MSQNSKTKEAPAAKAAPKEAILEVYAIPAHGFFRCGRKFSRSAPTYIKRGEHTDEELKRITEEKNLRVKELK